MPHIDKIRKYALCFIAALGFSGAFAPASKAQEEAAALAPIMAEWQSSQMRKFMLQIEAALDQVGISMQSLETAKNTADLIGSGFRTLTAVTEGYEDLEALYYTGKSLTSTCIYAYNWTKKAVTDGTITPQEAASMLRNIDYIAMRSAYIIENAIQTFFDSSKKLTWDQKIQAIKKSIQELLNWNKDIEKKIDDIENDKKDKAEQSALKESVQTAYGTISSDSAKIFKDPITVKNALENIKKGEAANKSNNEENASTPKSDGGNAVNAVATTIFGTRAAVLNLVCAIIGLLAVIMSIPALLKIAHGERQSQDALYKLFMGTIAAIFIIQVFGRFIISL